MILARRLRALHAAWLGLALTLFASAVGAQTGRNLLGRGPGAEPQGYATRHEAFGAALRDARVPRGQRPARVEHVALTDRSGRAVLNASGHPIATREYHYVSTRGQRVVVQDHSAGHTFSDHGSQGAHFNVRPAGNTRNGRVPGTQPHYSFPTRLGR